MLTNEERKRQQETLQNYIDLLDNEIWSVYRTTQDNVESDLCFHNARMLVSKIRYQIDQAFQALVTE